MWNLISLSSCLVRFWYSISRLLIQQQQKTFREWRAWSEAIEDKISLIGSNYYLKISGVGLSFSTSLFNQISKRNEPGVRKKPQKAFFNKNVNFHTPDRGWSAKNEDGLGWAEPLGVERSERSEIKLIKLFLLIPILWLSDTIFDADCHSHAVLYHAMTKWPLNLSILNIKIFTTSGRATRLTTLMFQDMTQNPAHSHPAHCRFHFYNLFVCCYWFGKELFMSLTMIAPRVYTLSLSLLFIEHNWRIIQRLFR